MKRIHSLVSAVLVLALALSMLTVPAFADETGYEPTDSYVLNYNGVYDGSKWQYFSPYWPAFTYDGKADYTQSISFTLSISSCCALMSNCSGTMLSYADLNVGI